MKKRKGNLAGRYVPDHMRKAQGRPYEYVNVSGWQERVEAIPSPVESVPPQAELDLAIAPKVKDEEPEE